MSKFIHSHTLMTESVMHGSLVDTKCFGHDDSVLPHYRPMVQKLGFSVSHERVQTCRLEDRTTNLISERPALPPEPQLLGYNIALTPYLPDK